MNKKGLYAFLEEVFQETKPSQVKNIVIIDAMNMFMRSFHMVNHIDADGDHVGGLAGFLKSVGSTIKLHKPSELYIIFDGESASSTKRMIYPEYKGTRKLSKISKPLLYESKEHERDAIYSQAIRAVGYCKLLPVKTLSIDNMEADDVIGVLARKFDEDESVDAITIVTEDRDYMQLVNKKTKIYLPVQRIFADTAYVLKKYDIHPNNFAVYKSLMKDPSDNIPGVKGLGPVTFQKFFSYLKKSKKYTINDVLNTCIDAIEKAKENNETPHSIFKKILAFKPQLLINNRLVDLHAIPFLPQDLEIIDELIKSKDYVYKPDLFLKLYNSDGLNNSIINVNSWLREVFQPLYNRNNL